MPMGQLPPEYMSQLHNPGPSHMGMMGGMAQHPQYQHHGHPGAMGYHPPPPHPSQLQRNTWDSDDETDED